jgi:hypothetical protein
LRSIALLVLLAPAVARAEDEPAAMAPAPEAPATAPVASGERVTMPAKRGMVHAQLGINLSTDNVGKPISLSPDIWYGINDKLTIGLIHTGVGQNGIQGGISSVGTSLCLTGEDNGCGKIYDNVGIDVRYTLKSDAKLALALDGGLFVNSFDPFQLSLKVGVAGRYRLGKQLALDFSPNLSFGVTERDGAVDAMGNSLGGNKEVLALPATFVYGLNEKVGLLGQVSLAMPFEDAGDLFAVGIALGGSYALNKQFSLELIFALPLVVTGIEDAGGVDARTLTLGGSYAF